MMMNKHLISAKRNFPIVFVRRDGLGKDNLYVQQKLITAGLIIIDFLLKCNRIFQDSKE